MIEILEIAENSPFPIIDFKFQNTGSATAFLWKFTVKILDIEIDRTPVLRHFIGLTPLNVDSRKSRNKIRFVDDSCEAKLTVTTRNDGWGCALGCEVQVSELPLKPLFTESARTFRGNIESEQSLITISLDPSTLNQEYFTNALQKHYEERANTSLRAIYDLNDIPEGCLPLRTPKVRSTFQDIHGISHEDVQHASTASLSGDCVGGLYLNRSSFKWINYRNFGLSCDSILLPSAVYYVSLNPEMQVSQHSYSISHKIPSGDVERFHIMIGSSKSCKAALRFEFSVDSESAIISDEFHVKISNPMNSNFDNKYNKYRDGDELLTLNERLKSKLKTVAEKDLDPLEDLHSLSLEDIYSLITERPELANFIRSASIKLNELNRSKFPFLNEGNSNEYE